MKLYHYVHCHYCLRVRMALGFLGLDYISVPLPYDDEETPVKLCRKKMLPIFEWNEEERLNESLDIIARLDQDNRLRRELWSSPEGEAAQRWMQEQGAALYSLTMPLFVWTKEFDEPARKYFQGKKEASRGPFNQLVLRQKEYVASLDKPLGDIEGQILCGDQPTILDIVLGSFLWGLYLVPEFQFPPGLHRRLQRLAACCRFDYHEDLWKSNGPMNYAPFRQ